MARFGRGLICVATNSERLKQLGIEQMVSRNRESFKTDFQVSVDAASGISTGISAADRARTIQIMADPTALPTDLVAPGHVFPLRAKPGGVLQRSGHTEAVADLASSRKGGERKVKVALEIRRETTITLSWIANGLCMGSAGYLKFLFHQTRKQLKEYAPNLN